VRRWKGRREQSSTGASRKSNGSVSSAPASWKVVKASSHQPSAWDEGVIPRANQLWNVSCARAGTEVVVAPEYSMPPAAPWKNRTNRPPRYGP
jgi:hypothetical protein